MPDLDSGGRGREVGNWEDGGGGGLGPSAPNGTAHLAGLSGLARPAEALRPLAGPVWRTPRPNVS